MGGLFPSLFTGVLQMSALAEQVAPRISINPELLNAIVGSVESALTMCGVTVSCVGMSHVPISEVGNLTGMIGVHGDVSGFVNLNMSERFAVRAVEGLLDTQYGKLTSQVVDGAGEITNLVVGGIKSALGGSEWSFSRITVPSVLVGNGYSVSYAKGLEFLCVTFEAEDPEAVVISDRLMQVSISLLRQ